MPASESHHVVGQRVNWPLAVLVLGVLLVVLSLLWPALSSGRAQWSDEQARAYQQISAELHGLSHSPDDGRHHTHDHATPHDHAAPGDPRSHAEQIAAAQARFNELRGELESAQQGPMRIAKLLWMTGILLVCAGGVASFRRQQRDTN
jgi:hypothetical protein